MGIWGTIAGAAATIGGSAVGAPWLGPVVGAAVNGIEQSHAANKAADQQIAAGDKALNLASGIYNNQTALLAPWRQGGQSALNQELAFLGLPQTGAPMAGMMSDGGNTLATAGAPTGVTGPSASYLSMNDMGAISDPSKNGGYAGQAPGSATLSSVSSYDSGNSYGPKSNPRPSFKMTNANGDTKTVSAELVADAQKDGWTVVGTA